METGAAAPMELEAPPPSAEMGVDAPPPTPIEAPPPTPTAPGKTQKDQAIDDELRALFAPDSYLNILMDTLVDDCAAVDKSSTPAPTLTREKTLEDLVDDMIRLQQGPDAATNERNKFRIEYLLEGSVEENMENLHRHIACVRVTDPEVGSELSPLEQLQEIFPAATAEILSKQILMLQPAFTVKTVLFQWKVWIILLFAHFTCGIGEPADGKLTIVYSTDEFDDFFVRRCQMNSFATRGRNHFLANFIYNQRSVRTNKIASAKKGNRVVEITFCTST